MKKGLRFLGIDDGPREAEKLIGVSYRGTEFIEQVEIIDQKPDKGDATPEIISLYSLFKQDIAAIFLDGISFNGFNVADITKVSEETGKPFIAVTVNKPDKNAMRGGLQAAGIKTDIVERLPEVQKVDNLFIQFSGCGQKKAERYLERATLQGNIPEAVRVADLIGNGLQETD